VTKVPRVPKVTKVIATVKFMIIFFEL